jgi:hypothetical protein
MRGNKVRNLPFALARPVAAPIGTGMKRCFQGEDLP